MNVEKKEKFTQVCVWPSCIVGEDRIEEFEEFMREKFGIRVQYLEEIKTNPDKDVDGNIIEGTGNRNDLFFAIHDEDVGKFVIPKLMYGISWIEDTLASCNNTSHLYPERVKEYECWEGSLSAETLV